MGKDKVTNLKSEKVMVILVFKLRDIQLDDFKQDILSSPLVTSPAQDIETLSRQFDTVLSELLDKHAPLQTKCITLRPHAPWYTDELRTVKRERRRCERQCACM